MPLFRRDSYISLLATHMRNLDMLKSAPAINIMLRNAGSLEKWGGATFEVVLCFRYECPKRRLEQLNEVACNFNISPHIIKAN